MIKMLKNILALVLAAALTVGLLPIQASAATADFADVAGHWAIEDIRWARSHNVVDGVGNNRFEPEGKVSNAAMIKMLCDAFFGSEYAACEAAHRADVERAFGGNVSWYSSRAYFFSQRQLLDNVDVVITDPASANADMSRNDMAMILYNVAARKGLTASEADKAAAQSSIRDYGSIPATHREAVKTCFALKLLNGSDGYFLGSQTMTRAQACAVIHRMSGLLGGGMTTDPTPSTPGEPTVKTIELTTKTTQYGTGYYVGDNQCGDGYLNNGKPITEENVIELLHEAEKIWPTGMTWKNSGTYNNHWYQSSSTITDNMMSANNTGCDVSLSANYACGGFAAMVSDYLFGHSSNSFHRVTDTVNGIRPGDVIIEVNTSTNRVAHAFIATSASFTEYEGNGTPHPGFVYGADGNSNGKVSWPGEYDSGTSEAGSGYTWQVYSRYPQSATTQPPAPTTTPDPTPSTPGGPTVKPIEVTNKAGSGNTLDGYTSGTMYYVTDNGFPDGYLNNGKPITTENVLELLAEAEKIWPTGMKWAKGGTGNGNNWYGSSGSVVSTMMKKSNLGTTTDLGSNVACGGFAAMISDYLFGRDNNNFHIVTDKINGIRPGDIVFIIDPATNTVYHAFIATSASFTEYEGNGTPHPGFIYKADGNSNGKVSWPGEYDSGTSEAGSGYVWQVYSRYPT